MLYKYSGGRELAEHFLVNFTHLYKKNLECVVEIELLYLILKYRSD